MSDTLKKVDALCRHIEEVARNCRLLGTRLIEQGHESLGLQLIANGFVHDQSKWTGIEWDTLFTEPTDEDSRNMLKAAISNHNAVNKHHPEAWAGGIKEMPSVFVAEMAADWVARASEFGTDVREWIDKTATKRYGFTKHTKVYREIQGYLNLLLEKPFS